MQTLPGGTLNKLTLSAGVEGFCFSLGHGDVDRKIIMKGQDVRTFSLSPCEKLHGIRSTKDV